MQRVLALAILACAAFYIFRRMRLSFSQSRDRNRPGCGGKCGCK
jgi:hypothetical protein